MARNSACASSHSAEAVKKHSTRKSAACTGFLAVTTRSAARMRMVEKTQKVARGRFIASLSVERVGRAVLGDLLFPAVAHREQHRLGEVEVALLLAVVLEDAGLDDGIDRAALLAEAAEDALGEVDVVARG